MENTARPKVSVIIPTYNRPQLIHRAVESALAQTYKNIEIIVIDCDPTGATGKALVPFVNAHPDVVVDFVFKQLPPTGTVRDIANIARNRNAGIRIAKGKYIAPLDDDDVWPDPEKIEKQVAFMEANPEYSITSGDLLGIIKNSDGTESKETALFAEDDKDIRKMMLMHYGLMNSTVMYRRSDWEKVGGYDETHPVSETQDFHLKLGRIGKFHNFRSFFVCYVMGEAKNSHALQYGRYCLWDGLRIDWTYRNDYPGFYKAFSIHVMYLLYTFVPQGIRKTMRPIATKIQFTLFRKLAGTDTKRTAAEASH